MMYNFCTPYIRLSLRPNQINGKQQETKTELPVEYAHP